MERGSPLPIASRSGPHRASRRPTPNARLNISRNTPPVASIAHGDVDHETFQNALDAGYTIFTASSFSKDFLVGIKKVWRLQRKGKICKYTWNRHGHIAATPTHRGTKRYSFLPACVDKRSNLTFSLQFILTICTMKMRGLFHFTLHIYIRVDFFLINLFLFY